MGGFVKTFRPWVTVTLDTQTLDVHVLGYRTEKDAFTAMEEILGTNEPEADDDWLVNPDEDLYKVRVLQLEYPVM